MPMTVMNDMMNSMRTTFPNWVSKFHGATKNADGTYAVLTQQCLGPMKADFPAMGPFPEVKLDTVAEVVKTEDLANPVREPITRFFPFLSHHTQGSNTLYVARSPLLRHRTSSSKLGLSCCSHIVAKQSGQSTKIYTLAGSQATEF